MNELMSLLLTGWRVILPPDWDPSTLRQVVYGHTAWIMRRDEPHVRWITGQMHEYVTGLMVPDEGGCRRVVDA